MAELRKDPILGDWVIIAPERATRPFDHDGENEAATSTDVCPFCQGNEALTPEAVLTIPSDSSPDEWAVRIVPNRYPAVGAAATTSIASNEFFGQAPTNGFHEVIVESPSHERSMRNLSAGQMLKVMRAWRDRLAEVIRDKTIAHTMIFKNEGFAAGASLEHVHSQLLATSFVPPKITAELAAGQKHFEETGKVVWTEMLNQELTEATRIVFENDDFVLLCPFASQFPGEMRLFPQQAEPAFEAVSEANLQSFAELLKSAIKCLHHVFPEAPFNLGLHTAPPRDDRREFYRWHLTITPRLTGIAGFEIASGSWINIVSPEDAASRYREAFRLVD